MRVVGRVDVPHTLVGDGAVFGSAVAVVSDESHGVLKVHFRASSRNGLSFDSP